MTSRFPLTWPDHIPRSKTREKGKFKATLASALKNAEDSIRLFARDTGIPVKEIIISSNVTLGIANPEDPGVAIWFHWDGDMRSIPVDRYTTVAANLQAIHHVVEARRVELRHGTLALVRATMRGFAALPAPGTRKTWREVFGVNSTSDFSEREITEIYRDLARTRHPNSPTGSEEKMKELNVARDQAIKEIKSK